jgi:hypothetical protein
MRRLPLWMAGAMIGGVLATAAPPLRGSAAGGEVGVNRITQVQPGMTMLQVLQTLGPPSDIVGPAFYYKDLGKVIFDSKGNPLDKTKVEKIEPSTIQNPVP